MRLRMWVLVAVGCMILPAMPQPHTITLEEPVGNWRVEDKEVDNGRVCGNIDIRNNVLELRKLRGCRIVDGFLQIVLIDKASSQHYNNFTFPELREITGYLMLYRVTGLKTLGMLFPNLSVIRGKFLIVNYSLIVFELFQLEDLGLRSLTAIVRGGVRIEKNPELCFLNTINWTAITANGSKHYIQDNKEASQCPACTDCPTGLCWNEDRCQQTDVPACHEQCLGGCWGKGPLTCNACRAMRLHGECLKTCPPDRYSFMNHYCVTEKQCQVMENQRVLGSNNWQGDWPFEAECVHHCPSSQSIHLMRSENGQVVGCEQCQQQCPCQGFNIDGIQAAQRMRGCTLIAGSLIIEVQGEENIFEELEENLGMIEEISGTLKIARSFPLKSLSFLKNLRVIHGITTDAQMPLNRSFLVYNNQNLKELWDWSKKSNDFKIKNGRLFFHDNPKLCISEIKKLNKIAGLGNFTNYEVSHTSNGDKVSCNHSNDINLVANVTILHSKSAVLMWKQLRVEDQALRYIVYYIKAPFQNVTSYDDTCGGNDYFWRINYVEIPSDPNVFHIITKLKPHSQYAYYVTLVTMSTYVVGQSSIRYFQTLPDRPSMPDIVKITSNSHSELEIQWKPPENVNGILKFYLITGTWLEDNQEYLDQRNYCKEPMTNENKQLTEDIHLNCADPKLACCDTEEYFVMENEFSHKKVCKIRDQKMVSDEGHFESKTKDWEDHVLNFLLTNYVDMTRSIDHSNTFLTQTNTVDEEPNTWGFEDNENVIKTSDKRAFVKKVTGNVTRLVVQNLVHFSRYSIEVKACRESFRMEDNQCSFASMATVQLLPKEDADIIDSQQVRVYTWNDTIGHVRIDWPSPKKPNGMIVSYHIITQRLNMENFKPTEECLTRKQHEQNGKGYLITSLSPGKYSFRIKAITLAGDGPLTKKFEYEVLEPLTAFGLGEAISIVTGLLFVFSAVVVLFIYLKRRRDKNLWLIASVNPDYMDAFPYIEDQWELERDNVQLNKELGKGSFGIVYEGVLKPENIPCAIKTINENSTPRQCAEFLNEASVMKLFSDAPYVVRLLGVVSHGQPPLVIMELMMMGDLKSYLRARRESSDRPDLNQMLVMAAQIADGMAYLEAKKFVHRDLAARNCMVGADLTVKVGDFGMTRDIYETDYYRNGTQGLLPVRWMAPECLADGVFTSSSDVWSYGVVLWEMATLAEQPYQGLANEQVMLLVLGGGVLERPTDCPNLLYSLMSVCWGWRPDKRPTFLQLVGRVDGAVDLGLQFQLVSFFYSQENNAINIYTDPQTQQVVAQWTAQQSPSLKEQSESPQLQKLPPPPKKIHSNQKTSGES